MHTPYVLALTTLEKCKFPRNRKNVVRKHMHIVDLSFLTILTTYFNTYECSCFFFFFEKLYVFIGGVHDDGSVIVFHASIYRYIYMSVIQICFPFKTKVINTNEASHALLQNMASVAHWVKFRKDLHQQLWYGLLKIIHIAKIVRTLFSPKILLGW